MGKLVRSIDWTNTPLGPTESWPQSLRTAVSLCLASNFPISLAWGPKHVQIYNDGYWPICGGKHPHSMGEDFSECWASAWPVIGEAFERALAGKASYLENQRMFLDRNGYLEETFFTFSFSPIRDESGGVGGLFHPVTEMTSKLVAERRTRALRDLAAQAGGANTTEEALTHAAATISEFDLDIPFALFYLLTKDGSEARLIARTESCSEAIAFPTVDLASQQQAAWPMAEVALSNRSQIVDNLESRFGAFSCGPYPETPKAAMVLPITPPGCERPLVILIAGISSRLPLNEAYRAFYDLLAASATSAVANARALEEERKRAEALAEIDRAKTAFFSNVSHEFRTPLTLMLGPLEDELAERASPLPADRRARLETAHRNTLRLLKLVNSLLDFSSIESGRAMARYEETDLGGYTADLASSFRSATDKAGLTLTVNCPALPEPIYVDTDMWEKIVLNLLSNAFKHTFEGGIQVTLAWGGDHAELAVADSGVGIPESELPRLFDRFHRVRGTRSRTHEGTGIGLALVQELVHQHNGTMRVESREGEGTTFFITVKAGREHLPLERIVTNRTEHTTTGRAAYVAEVLQWVAGADNALDSPAPLLEPPEPSERNKAVDGARPRILWADDNADMRDYVRRLLSPHYDVTAVPDGEMALAHALSEPPDLVLSDVMMPRMDGFGLLRALRSHEQTRTIPVILLSARAGEASAVEGLDAGADDYLVKPFSARELLARVRTHLEMGRLRRGLALELERRVDERTAELMETTRALEIEIAERKRTEVALRDSEQRYRTVGETASDAMITIDESSSIVFVNRAAERIFGYSREEMLGQSLTMLMPGALRQLHLSSFERYHESRAKHISWEAVELPGLHKNGTEIPLEISFGEFMRGGEHYFTGIARDITDRKHMEEQLRQSQKMEAIGQLAGGVAHDFNNLLTVIVGYSQLLLSETIAQSVREGLDQIARAADRASALTRQLLAFSRKQILRPEVVNPNEIINELEKMLARLIGEDLELVTRLDPRLDRITIDPSQMEQIIVNLAVNSRDAMPDGGKLTIETENVYLDEEYSQLHAEVEPGWYVRMALSDTGSGMDEATKARLFEPFFTTKEMGKGTGLGLSTVHGIVKQSGGHIWIYSEVDRGTTFKLYFPVTAAAGEEPRELAERRVSPGGSETILIIEDDDAVRNLAVEVLAQNGYTVFQTGEPMKAGSICEAYPGTIDLLITDVIMPGLSGRRLVDELSPAFPEMHILYMSGYTDNAIVHHGVLEEGLSFLQKPFTPDTLLRKVREVLDAA